MGQCATVQQNSLREELRENLNNSDKTIQQKPRRKNTNKKNSFSKITYIEHNDQLIYQFDQISRSSQTLPIKKWSSACLSQQKQTSANKNLLQISGDKDGKNQKKQKGLVLVQAVSENLFITNSNKILQIFSIKDSGLNGKQFLNIAELFYELNQLKQNLNNLKPILKNHQPFVLPQGLYIKQSAQTEQQNIIIVQSQQFQNQIVSLKLLGRHMHLNDIQWQDRQFLSIIEASLWAIQLLHQQNIYQFSQIFIDTDAKCYCLGGFSSCKSSDSISKSKDLNHLYEYLISALYGDQKYLNQALRQQAQDKCKFTHSESIKKLNQILLSSSQPQSSTTLTNKNLQVKTSNKVSTYIDSFKAKRNQNYSQEIAIAYSRIGDLQKCKQILIQLYSLSLYNEASSKHIAQSNRKTKWKSHNQFTKNQTSKNEGCLQLFVKIINLQKKIMKVSQTTQIQQLCNQFVKIVLFMSKRQIQKGNYLRSLTILQKIQQVTGDDEVLVNLCQHWAVSIQKAENYFLLEDIQQAQKFYNEAFKCQLNQTTLCKIVKFYVSVLNWQHAISILRQYQSVIQQHYLYQFFVAKCILAKSLCVSPSLKQNQQERNHLLIQSIRIFKRVLQRKFKNNIFLIQTYEAIGDCYFYMMAFSDAMSNYEKSLALTQLQQNQNQKEGKNSQNLKMFQQQQNIFQIHKKSEKKSNNKSILNTSISFANTSPSFQNYEVMNPNKKSILESSIANIYLMEKKYTQCLQTYEKARKSLNNGNLSLKNSIIGNMGICLMEMGRKQEGKETIKHIFKDLDKRKVQKDINYIFLKEECNRK